MKFKMRIVADLPFLAVTTPVATNRSKSFWINIAKEADSSDSWVIAAAPSENQAKIIRIAGPVGSQEQALRDCAEGFEVDFGGNRGVAPIITAMLTSGCARIV